MRRAAARLDPALIDRATSSPGSSSGGRRLFVPQRIRPFLAAVNQADLLTLAGLIDAGKISPVIDRTYPLSEVPEAIRYLEQGHACGKIVITM